MLYSFHDIINNINDIIVYINDMEQLCHKPDGLLVDIWLFWFRRKWTNRVNFIYGKITVINSICSSSETIQTLSSEYVKKKKKERSNCSSFARCLVHSKWKDLKHWSLFVVFVVTKLSNFVVNDFDGKKSVHCNQMSVVTKLVVNGTHCTRTVKRSFHAVT